jgi:transposase-like protein
MSPKSSAPAAKAAAPRKPPAEQVVRDIRRATRKQHSAEEKIRIVLEGLRGEESIAALCRREGIAESLYYSWTLLCSVKRLREFGPAASVWRRDSRRFRGPRSA